jgi:hypothetical protein
MKRRYALMSSTIILEVLKDVEFHVIRGVGTKDLEGEIALLLPWWASQTVENPPEPSLCITSY